MNLLSKLQKMKSELLKSKQTIKNEKPSNINNVDENTDNITIIIENNDNLFEGEEEIIKRGGKTYLESGIVSNLEEGCLLMATEIRGLKYKRTENDEDGNMKIIFDGKIKKNNNIKM